jgi:lipopolysaccharide biosynthesis protein
MQRNKTKAICFYLPQFHPIPENDAWWGKGFTEWTNVVKAKPWFKGHYQPHLPADLGFYDLRLSEVREAQAELARAHGIHGFCYYHYWFNGRRLLERPFQEVLATGRPDFPFCLCWANENWTRRWDGQEAEILMGQKYCAEDDAAHFRALLPAFRDPRYLRIKGRPVFLIYRASNLPDLAGTLARWRAYAVRADLPGLYLCNVESFGKEHGQAATKGFDAAVEFAPDWTCASNPLRRTFVDRVARKSRLSDGPGFKHRIYSYSEIVANMLNKPRPDYLRFPCVTPSWDNTARRKENGVILDGSNPASYERWLAEVVARFKPPSDEENLVFINAWNEWAEGNHLEPCQRWGHGYLEATARALGHSLSNYLPRSRQDGRHVEKSSEYVRL